MNTLHEKGNEYLQGRDRIQTVKEVERTLQKEGVIQEAPYIAYVFSVSPTFFSIIINILFKLLWL